MLPTSFPTEGAAVAIFHREANRQLRACQRQRRGVKEEQREEREHG